MSNYALTPPVLLLNLAGTAGSLVQLGAAADACGWVRGRDFVNMSDRGVGAVHHLPPEVHTVIAALGPGMLPAAMLDLLRQRIPEQARVFTIASGSARTPADLTIDQDTLRSAARAGRVVEAVSAALHAVRAGQRP